MFKYVARDAIQVLPEGEYQAEIKSAEEKVSKNGNDMMVVQLRAFHGERSVYVTDFITSPYGIKQYKELAVALGEERAFDLETFNVAEHIGKLVTVKLGVKKATGEYQESNTVKGYRVPAFDPATDGKLAAARANDKDAEIPF